MQIVFETPRLMLRHFTDSETDADLVLQLNSDDEVVKYLHEPRLKNKVEAKEILRNIILPQYDNHLGRWATYSKQTDEFIGWCGLKYRPQLDDTDLGYRFKKSAWGKGFATEAAEETLKYGFKNLQLKTIIGRAHIHNIASLRVLEKIGMQFVHEGIVDDCSVKTYIAQNPSN